MILDIKNLVQVSAIGNDDGVIELELDGKAPELVTASGEIIFVCRYCGNIFICIGRVEKYEEVQETVELGHIFSRLKMRGRNISFSI